MLCRDELTSPISAAEAKNPRSRFPLSTPGPGPVWGSAGGGCRFEHDALFGQPRNAALGHVDDVLGAVQLEQAGGGRSTDAAGADDGDRALRVKALGDRSDVVPGHGDRAGHVARVPLAQLADV